MIIRTGVIHYPSTAVFVVVPGKPTHKHAVVPPDPFSEYTTHVFAIVEEHLSVGVLSGAHVPNTRQILTIQSLVGGGDLSADRVLSLVNDEDAPGPNQVYGTDAAGVRGWKDTLENDVATPGPGMVYGTDNEGTRGWKPDPVTEVSASGTALLAGGGVAWLGNLDFHVSAARYQLQGVQYTSAADDVSLTPADTLYPRIDLIAVDDTGSVVVLTGTPAAAPEKPDVDPASQLELTFVYVGASATAPGVTVTPIYRENTEWTTSKNGTTINLASTVNPFAGAVNVEATAAATGHYAHFQTGTAFDPNNHDSLVLRIRSKAAWPSKRLLDVTLRNGATQQGSTVVLKDGAYGFSSSITSEYQTVVIPLSDFAAGGRSVNALRIAVGGSTGNIGFHLDSLELQTGIAPPSTDDSSRMRWRGLYSAATAYNVNDVVLSAGVQYVCIAPATGFTPKDSPAYWQVSTSSVMSFMRGAAFVSSSPLTVAIAPASVYFHTAAVLKKVVVLGDVAGDVTVDMKKIAVGSYDPASGISMCGGDFPKLIGAKQSVKTTFAGWTAANVAAGDVINFSLNTVAMLKRVTVQAFFEEVPT